MKTVNLNNLPISSTLKQKISKKPTYTEVRNKDNNIWKNITIKNKISRPEVKIPDSFNGKEVWKKFLSPVKNQGNCGACWGFASSSTLADRFNILSRGVFKLDLSAEIIILCDLGSIKNNLDAAQLNVSDTIEGRNYLQYQINQITQLGCYGSTLNNAWIFLYLVGTNTTQCIPYTSNLKIDSKTKSEIKSTQEFSIPQKTPICSSISGIFRDMCSDVNYNPYTGEETGKPARFYKAKHFYALAGTPQDGGSEYIIKHDIFLHGPVSSAMMIYSDFYTFDSKNDVYKWDKKSPLTGGHAIEIVGWGKQKNNPYWIVKNSWGINWGDEGYFKILRGVNECDIENNVITGLPDFFLNEKQHLELYHLYLKWDDQYFKDIKNIIDKNISIIAGGINPETGYSRRVMTTMPWLDFTPPIALTDLPNFSKFIAGDINKTDNIDNIDKTDKIINRPVNNNRNFYFFIIIISILIFIVLTVLFIYFIKKRKTAG